ncbi:hypothetical protein JHK87_047068 [Glycine soja]|nr:hypothetical protein JHK87_047068 [Glycine soja]
MVEYHLIFRVGSKNRSSEFDVVEQGHAIEGRSGDGESLARYHFQDFGARNEDLEARRWERERGEVEAEESYIVYLGSHSFGPNPSSIDVESVTMSHYDILESYVGSTEKALEAIFYSYKRYINGFAAILDEDEAANVSMHPNVISVFLNKERKLHTTNSWNFLGLERNGVFPHDSVWKKTKGEDIIIGNIDTGVWPESKSFSDEGFGPIPKRWRGICQTEDKFHCNRKLIGARYFYKGYEAGSGIKLNASEVSVRDYEGHGSHTLSTAGGNFVAGASVFGFGNGTASGGSPKARVAAYKACWPDTFFGGCFDADILAAFEAAISDGVDVISMSLGSEDPPEYFQSSISIASFHAVANGITVVGSGGNSGPSPGTVSNNEPWMLTVAASTTNRDFASHVTLGDKKILKGASLSEHHLPSNKMYPLISAVDAGTKYAAVNDTPFCLNKTLDPEKVRGKILVCLRGVNGRIEKGVIAASLGAVGMILANDKDSGNEVLSDPHVLPTSHVNFASGSYIYNYINHTKSPVAYISKAKTELGVKPAPFVASFSSRGPNLLEPAILKPDVTAPGVDIIAAYTEAVSPTDEASDTQRTPYYALSGTSMSCPHVAGLVGLLKAFHPDWSPAAIKSAIITSATTKGNNRRPILNSSFVNEATPFDYGGGHIRPNHAVDPGLVYDLNTADYLNFLCSRGYNSSQLKLFYGKPYTCPKSFSLADFNYPTITVPRIHPGHSVNVTRTVTNVGSPSMYRVLIKAPPQVVVSVEPKKLRFKKKGEKKEFRVTLTLKPQTKKLIGARYLYKGYEANSGTKLNASGNSGTSPGTASNNEPWMLTVAASTTDRDFASYVTLGDKKIIKGASLSEHHLPSNKLYLLISSIDAKADNASIVDVAYCDNGTLDPEKAKGKILVCFGTDKGVEAIRVGAVGLILAFDNSGLEILADLHLLPASNVGFVDGNYIYNYIRITKSPVACISRVKTELGVKSAPFVAPFSSRGPNPLEPTILKPDVTSPGTDIIAAYSEAISPIEQDSDKRRTPYITLSSTSMSRPHVAGLALLLKSLHPDWSPAAIKSAIITSATTVDNTRRPILDSTLVNEATPFDYGAGHIRPNRAADLDFLADFNYPAVTVAQLDPGHSLRVTRTVTNVGSPSTYRVHSKAPPQVAVPVKPRKRRFKKKGERKEFRLTLTLKPQTKNATDYVFGWLTWTDHKHHVMSPNAVNLEH